MITTRAANAYLYLDKRCLCNSLSDSLEGETTKIENDATISNIARRFGRRGPVVVLPGLLPTLSGKTSAKLDVSGTKQYFTSCSKSFKAMLKWQ